MKKILYLMHLPWGWIKQRPHFIAEHLTRYYAVDVVYRFYRVPFEGKLVRNAVLPGLALCPLVILPFNRFSPIAALNARIIRHYLKRNIGGYDIIWISHPEMFEAVEPIIPAGARVVYDCMDNHLAFELVSGNPSLTRRIRDAEKRLLERSDIVIASSQNLKDTLIGRHGASRRIEVVNNGIYLEDSGETAPLPPTVEAALATASFKLVYIGTVAGWLDCELLLATAARFPEITIYLVGPSEVELTRHERIVHLGPIVHRQIYAVMARSDALIMPFKVDELILGVDPVKLYEYVYSGKPALAVAYPESGKFGDYVHLYRDRGEYFALLEGIVNGRLGAKRQRADCVRFAEANSWERRVEQIVKAVRSEE
jgi:glycosyl transferase family 4